MKIENSLILFMICLILLTIYYFATKFANRFDIIETRESFDSFKQYITKYKISNFFFTIINSVIYLITTIIFFLCLRLIILGDTTLITKYHSSTLTISNFFLIILNLFLVLLSIILYKNIINTISYFDIIRLRIYLDNNYYYYVIRDMLCYKYVLKICGFCWFYCYRIANLTFPEEIKYNQQIHDDEYQYIYLYTNKNIKHITSLFMYFSKKNKAFFYFFYKIASLFKFLYNLIINSFFSYTPYVIFILVLFHDLKNAQFYHIYYVSLVCFIIVSLRAYRTFENNLDLQSISELHDIYYKSNTILADNLIKTLYKENDSVILKAFRHNLKIPPVIVSLENKRIQLYDILHYTKIYITFVIATIFFTFAINIKILIKGYEISFNHFAIVIIGILIFIIKKNYYKSYINENTIYEKLFEYHYNYKCELLYWILTLFSISFIWFVFVVPELFIINSEILLELPLNIFKVIKIFSTEEKINYLFQLFEYYVQHLQFENIINDRENLRYILRQLNWDSLITNDITLNDLRVYIALLFDTNFFFEAFLDYYREDLSNYIEQFYIIEQKSKNAQKHIKPLINGILLAALKLFIIKYLPNISPQILLHKFINNTNSSDIIKIIKVIHNFFLKKK